MHLCVSIDIRPDQLTPDNDRRNRTKIPHCLPFHRSSSSSSSSSSSYLAIASQTMTLLLLLLLLPNVAVIIICFSP
jgi:hypothetical protein